MNDVCFATKMLINNRMTKAIKVSRATYTPNMPIWLAIVSNFSYNGVISSSKSKHLSAFPARVYSPTAKTSAFPSPASAKVAWRTKGTGLC